MKLTSRRIFLPTQAQTACMASRSRSSGTLNFVVIETSSTYSGDGEPTPYTGRNLIDAATLDKMAITLKVSASFDPFTPSLPTVATLNS